MTILYPVLFANLAVSAAIIVVILVREPVRRLAGARLAYWLWAAPVAAGLAALLRGPDAAPPPGIAALLLGLWIAGALACFALIVFRQHRAMAAFGHLQDGDDEDSLRATGDHAGPAVVGLISPHVVTPADFYQRYSQRERLLILAHERAHLAAGHTRINAGIALATCACWFNPLVHLAARLSRTDQELACDAAVIERFPGERRTYAEALLKMQLARPMPLGCTWPSKTSSQLKQRVEMLSRSPPDRARWIAGAGLIATAALSAGYAGWATRPPELKPAAPASTAAAAQYAEQAAQRAAERAAEWAAELGPTEPPEPIVVSEADLAGVPTEIKMTPEQRVEWAWRTKATARMAYSLPDQKVEARELDPLSDEQLRAISAAIEEASATAASPTDQKRDRWELAWYSGRLTREGAYPPESRIPEGKTVEVCVLFERSSGGGLRCFATRFLPDFSPTIDFIPKAYAEMRVDAKADGAMTFAMIAFLDGKKILLPEIRVQSDGFGKARLPGGRAIAIFATLREQTAGEKEHAKRMAAARTRGRRALEDERLAFRMILPPYYPDPSLAPSLDQLRAATRKESAIRALGAGS